MTLPSLRTSVVLTPRFFRQVSLITSRGRLLRIQYADKRQLHRGNTGERMGGERDGVRPKLQRAPRFRPAQ